MRTDRIRLGAVAAVEGRVRDSVRILGELEAFAAGLLDDRFFAHVPFETIHLVFGYTQATGTASMIRRPKKYDVVELPVSVHVAMSLLRRQPANRVSSILTFALLKALQSVAERYSLPRERIDAAMDALVRSEPQLPEWWSASTEPPVAPAAESPQPSGPTGMLFVKRSDEGTDYFNLWLDDEGLELHHGRVGDPGTLEQKALQSGGVSAFRTRVAELLEQGYRVREEGDLVSVSIEYPVDGWGTDDDLERRHAIEELLQEHLQGTGNGFVEAGQIGSGGMEVFCCVVEPGAALATIAAALEERGWLRGARITVDTPEE